MIRIDEPAGVPPPIPGFDFVRPIGRGGMGEVFLARQESLGRPVAVKLLGTNYQSLSDERMVRFRREAELMARVNHPNVLTVFDSGTVDGRPYLVMEYAEGGDLRTLMRGGVPLAVGRARSILGPVGDALACLHRNGILHRDLKPENVLLDADGRPKVADFGIAVLRRDAGALTGTGVGLGTPGYIAPEQQYQLKVDERADQYSMAALAYEMLTGHVPLGVPRPPSGHNPALGPEVDAVLLRGMAEDPDDRFPDIPALLAALDAALDARPSPARRRRLAVAAAGVTAAAAAVIALLAFNVRPDPEARATPRTGGDAPADPATNPPDEAVMTPADPEGGPLVVAAAPPDEDDPGAQPPPARPPADPLVPLIEAQIERFARGEAGNDLGRDDWIDAVDALLGHGPLADMITQHINEEAGRLREGGPNPEEAGRGAWPEARRRFLRSDALAGLVREAIAAEVEAIRGEGGPPEGEAAGGWGIARRRLIDDGRLLPSRFRDELGLAFVLIPAGSVLVPTAGDGPDSEREVRLRRPIYLAEHELTIRAFARFVEQSGYRTTAEREGWAIGFDPDGGGEIRGPQFSWRNPGYSGEPFDSHPVVQVTWEDAVAFCAWATSRFGTLYRLPREGEWRYAFHASRARAREAGEPEDGLGDEAWFERNSGLHAHRVGSKQPNALGLFDLLGNAAEWCQDDCPAPPTRDHEGGGKDGKTTVPGHPALGGSWINTVEQLRPWERPCFPSGFRYPSIGFRPCLDLNDVRHPARPAAGGAAPGVGRRGGQAVR